VSLRQKALSLAPEAKNVRILTIDIESKPLTVYTWSLWDQHVGIDQIVDHGGLLCFAAKWAGDKEVLFFSEWGDGYQAMLEAAHRLLSEADIVVTYNGDRYDTRKLNQAFMLAGMAPPKPFKSVDLIKTNKQRFDLPSRKLDYLVRQTGVGAKVPHQGFSLWVDCMNGDPKAHAVMEKYNRGDVIVTEKAYLRLLPWLTNTPHMGMFTRDERSCPYCGSTKLSTGDDPLDQLVHANVTSYRLFKCLRCEGWSRSTTKLQDATRTRAVR